ncbi:MAG: tetratricopeptide repeat protein [Sphingobacteriales bacterium]|nr:MAG: tetratricopeptide repeat protein [Sphingobacteriales bacterium]
MEAYNAIFGLRLNEARALIREEKQQNPQNGITIMLENYVDYFSILTSDNKNDYAKMKERRSTRIDALEENDKNSPYYLYAQAEVYMQWGMLKGKYGDYMASASDLKKARGLLKDNVKKYPDFLPSYKNLALIEVVFGALPSSMKSIASFLGMKGNIQTGVNQLEKLRTQVQNTKYSFYSDEIVFFLCYMDIDVLHNKGNYSKLSGYLATMDDKSLLKGYLQGYVAYKTAHNNDAIAYLEKLPKGSQYTAMPAINYLLGNAKLCRMDTDANAFLGRYINEYKGMNYIKDSYLKLAYFYLLNGDEAKYNNYIKLVRTKGYTVDEKDKQALKEANDTRPDIDLLKARLYFDGGYYTKALAELKDEKVNSFKIVRDKMEFYYRLGRVYERLDKPNEALANYQRTINLGRTSTYYFAANAALSMGTIYEKKKKAPDFIKAAGVWKRFPFPEHEVGLSATVNY